MRSTLSGCLLLLALPFAIGQDPEVKAVRDRYAEALPTDKQLAFYSLDWAPSLAEAKVRAAKENRPIFFLYLTNITASTNFFSGHC